MKKIIHALNPGTVVSVRGSIVDVKFDKFLPEIYSLLYAENKTISIEVLSQLDERHVRGIALTATQGLSRGSLVEDSDGPLIAPVGKDILSSPYPNL
ncbi:MAG: hypothetical protein H7249_02365 [Chitinophagaceae bacterium]|nr:hypothetical protein [Oligoflexus sp.]